MAEYLTNDTELKTIANAIRTKTGGSTNLIYPSGFANAITGIAADCNATASQIMNGRTAYVGNSKITGTMTAKGAATYNVSASNQTISSGQYLDGAQTIRGVTTTNLSAGNIKKGVTVQVGDAASAGRIASVTGTCQEVYTNMPQSADCYVPFMFKSSDSYPVAFYWNGSGWRVSGGGASSKNFMVPCAIKMTYYAEDTSVSTSSVTFNPGNVYTLAPYNNQVAQISGGGLSAFHVYKVTKWEMA